MKTIFHPASERGKVDFGWLNSHHSFSFGHWYNPEKLHFGSLRVVNDDKVRGGAGFGAHPHDNMEIVSIPLSGALAHKDSTGTDGIIKTGDVQIMSAGSGIQHSEFNASKTDPVEFLQIWVYPRVQDIKPHYEQKTFNEAGRQNKWQIVVSPDASDGGVWINQASLFSLVNLDKEAAITYKTRFPGNGVFFFLLEGSISIEGNKLGDRDALGVWDSQDISLTASEASKILAIEVPMQSPE